MHNAGNPAPHIGLHRQNVAPLALRKIGFLQNLFVPGGMQHPFEMFAHLPLQLLCMMRQPFQFRCRRLIDGAVRLNRRIDGQADRPQPFRPVQRRHDLRHHWRLGSIRHHEPFELFHERQHHGAVPQFLRL